MLGARVKMFSTKTCFLLPLSTQYNWGDEDLSNNYTNVQLFANKVMKETVEF